MFVCLKKRDYAFEKEGTGGARGRNDVNTIVMYIILNNNNNNNINVF